MRISYPDLDSFSELWSVDFEFRCPPGHLPHPVCMVAVELHSGRVLRLREDELCALRTSPFPEDGSALLLAYYASAEMGCFLSLNWRLPPYLIDLYAEFRCLTNGRNVSGRSLLDALRFYGLETVSDDDKEAMRQLIINHESYSTEQMNSILDYCATDVDAVARLWERIAPMIRGERFAEWSMLLRGDYMKSVALMERRGIPVGADVLSRIKHHRRDLRLHLINEIERSHGYGVYDGTRFSSRAFSRWLERQHIPWPTTDTGALELNDTTFKTMSKRYPAVAPLRTLRQSLAQLRKFDLPVGPDGRNRFSIAPFRSATGRNQPPTSKFIFGQPKWLRKLIRPEPGRALAYIDWEQQEFGIVAKLSEDGNMMEAYRSGDPYLSFAKMSGAVPPDATRQSHARERAMYKVVVLGTQYSMSERGLMKVLGCTSAEAHQLMRHHRGVFPQYWEWVNRVVTCAQLGGPLVSTLGWQRFMREDKHTAQSNFLSQSNGAEMMRLASVLAMGAGVEVCCPIHDAFLIESSMEGIDDAVVQMQDCMAEASRIVLSGFELRSDAEIIRYPETYTVDTDQAAVWDIVTPFIEQLTHVNNDMGGVSILTHPSNII